MPPEWQFPLLATKFIRLALLSDQTREPLTERRVKSVCTQKVAYRSAMSAKAAAAECLRKYGALGLEAYECPCCKSYHVGHSNVVRPAIAFNEDCIIAIRKLASEDMAAARRFVVYSYRINKEKVDKMPISPKTERSRRCIESVKVQAMVVLSLREKELKDAERLPG